MGHSYLIRYGTMGQVGRFVAADPGASFDRGQAVVIRSHRGTELGEVLIEAPARGEFEPEAGAARVLRAADADDLARAEALGRERDERFATCLQAFRGGVWPIELIDVEPLLDDRRTVLHYLGPHKLDVAGVLAAFRATCDLDVMLQPVGRDVPEDEDAEDEQDHEHGCGSCGEGGGCGSAGGCGTSSGGCADCGVKKLLNARR